MTPGIVAQLVRPVNLVIQAFLSSGTFVVPAGVTSLDVLVVAGGGGGGSRQGGGGGAGGLIMTSVAVTPGASVAVVVGAGGAGGTNGGRGANGSNSSFGSIVAIGGGGGGGRTIDNAGASGGSGGGSVFTANLAGGSGTAGQGNAGGMSTAGPGGGNLGAGGGGAGAVGGRPDPINPSADYQADAGDGGAGIYIAAFAAYGAGGWFAGGGGGGGYNTFSTDGGGTGGQGGGGKGHGTGKDSPVVSPGPGIAGAANTGGGGGGSGSGAFAGGSGGSGIVIISRPAGGDPYWANVVSLLHFDGANGSTTFTDVTGKAWTVNYGVSISTAASAFGGASGLFAGNGWLATPASSAFDIGTGDFTLESTVWQNSTTGIQMILNRQIDSPVGIALQLRMNAGKPEIVLRGKNGGSVVVVSGATALAAGQFHRVAARRIGGVVELYANNVLVGSAACAFDMSAASARGMIIGASDGNSPGSNSWFNGYIDELRITVGVARDLTTPQTVPFPNA